MRIIPYGITYFSKTEIKPYLVTLEHVEYICTYCRRAINYWSGHIFPRSINCGECYKIPKYGTMIPIKQDICITQDMYE